MGLIGYLNTLLSALTGDVSISSPANNDYLRYVNSTGKWTNTPIIGTEASTTVNSAAANDTAIGSTSVRNFAFVTLPSTAPFYLITGMEWKNGTTAAGTINVAIETVDADPPTIAKTTTVAWSGPTAQSGTSAVQRVGPTNITSILIPGGTVLGCFVSSSSATSKFFTATVSSRNNQKANANANDPIMANVTAWTATTEEHYFKLYYKPVLGV